MFGSQELGKSIKWQYQIDFQVYPWASPESPTIQSLIDEAHFSQRG